MGILHLISEQSISSTELQYSTPTGFIFTVEKQTVQKVREFVFNFFIVTTRLFNKQIKDLTQRSNIIKKSFPSVLSLF